MADFIPTGWVARLGELLALGATSPASQVQLPEDPNNYSRTNAYTYHASGLRASETVEPSNAQLCVTP
jgi:hypothetical protein